MSYVAWSVVFGEQPTAAKWNILGTNDESFHDGTGIDDDAIITRHILDANVTAPKLVETAIDHGYTIIAQGSNSAQSSLSLTNIPAFDRLRVLVRFAPSTSLQPSIRFNNDSGGNYSNSHSLDLAAPISAFSQTSWLFTGTTSIANWTMAIDIMNLPTLIKSMTMNGMSGVAGSNPNIRFGVGTWNNTSVRINRIDLLASTGNLGTASMVVLGLNEA